MKNKSKIIILGLSIIIALLIVIILLILKGTIPIKQNQSKKINNNINEQSKQESKEKTPKNYFSIIPEQLKEDTITKDINMGEEETEKLIFSRDNNGYDNLIIGDKEVEKEEQESFDQITVYNDIIIISSHEFLMQYLKIYNLLGSKIKDLSEFTDEQNRYFASWGSYSETEKFHVEKDGTIYIPGSKHRQGWGKDYINNNGETIDYCQKEDKNQEEVISAIFKLKYKGNKKFSNITFEKMLNQAKDYEGFQCN